MLSQDMLSRITKVKWAVGDTWISLGVLFVLNEYLQRLSVPGVGDGFANSFSNDQAETPATESIRLSLVNHNAANIPDPLVITEGSTPSAYKLELTDTDPPPIGLFDPLAVDDPDIDVKGGTRLFQAFGGQFGPNPGPWAPDAARFRKKAVYFTRAFFGNLYGDPAPNDINSMSAGVLINVKTIQFKTPLDVDAQANRFRFTLELSSSDGDKPNVRQQASIFMLTGRSIDQWVAGAQQSYNGNPEPKNVVEEYYGATDGGWRVLGSSGSVGNASMSAKVNRSTLVFSSVSPAFNFGSMDQGKGPWEF